MHTARMTILMPPEQKASIVRRAARLGVSSGEFVRLATDRFDEGEVEAELEALTEELEAALPRIKESLESIERSIGEARAAIRESLETAAAFR